MPGTTVEQTTDGLGHARRAAWSHARVRSGSRSHALRSLPRSPEGAADAAVLHERARIARELHDNVSQTLYAIALRASRAHSLLQQNEGNAAQRIIDDVLQLANAGQVELRALLTDIRSDQFASGGLTAALAHLATDWRTRSDLDIRLSVSDEPNVPAPTKAALVMIVREALHNVVRHAAARRVDIALELRQSQFVMLIIDDGRGFDTGALRPGHFGLQSMRERATAVGGTVAFASAIGLGTQVRVCIPLQIDSHG
jgi:signal transduction histidine kinase